MNKTMTTIVLFFVFFLFVTPQAFSQEQNSIQLTPLNGELEEDFSFLENGAGISAYGQLNYVDLDLAANAFKYVEKKTENYIIGVVSLPGYDEEHDVHVYVDDSLWIIAYYLGQEKPGKIIDWVDYYSNGTVTGTKLEMALNKVVGEMSSFLSNVNYYDFRYPNATNITIITDEEGNSGGTETFRFMVPNTHFLHSKTWSHATYVARGSTCKLFIDGNQLNAAGGRDIYGWSILEGNIPPELVIYNTFHTVSILHWDNTGSARSFGAIVLIYSQL